MAVRALTTLTDQQLHHLTDPGLGRASCEHILNIWDNFHVCLSLRRYARDFSGSTNSSMDVLCHHPPPHPLSLSLVSIIHSTVASSRLIQDLIEEGREVHFQSMETTRSYPKLGNINATTLTIPPPPPTQYLYTITEYPHHVSSLRPSLRAGVGLWLSLAADAMFLGVWHSGCV